MSGEAVIPGGVYEPIPLERLHAYPVFARVAESVLRKLQAHVSERPFVRGDLLLRLGDYSDAAFLIASGSVSVVIPANGAAAVEPKTPAAATLRDRLRRILGRTSPDVGPPAADRLSSAQTITLGAGEIVGELGALSRYPVTADVIGASDGMALMVRTPALRMMLKQRDLSDFRQFVDDRYRTRALASHLRAIELFTALDDESIAVLRDKALLRSYEPGQSIVAEGEHAAELLLVRGGFVKLTVRTGDVPLAVTYLRKGEYAGEQSVVGERRWPFSLQAIDHVEIVAIPREALVPVLAAHPGIAELLGASAGRRTDAVRAARQDPLSSRHLQMAVDSGLIDGESILLIDLLTCTGCDDCVTACADTHGGIPRFTRQGTRYEGWSIAHACHQCSDPVCMVGCPTGAITRPLGRLEVIIDPATCIACGNCVRRCPWDNILTVPRQDAQGRTAQLPVKCDLCVGRAAGPACVQMCPHGSAVRLSLKDPQQAAQVLERHAAPAVAATGAPAR